MVANDRQPKSKKKLMDEAKEKFGVGAPTFRKAWDKLIEETGRQKWKEPGRPPKSCTT